MKTKAEITFRIEVETEEHCFTYENAIIVLTKLAREKIFNGEGNKEVISFYAQTTKNK